MNAASLLLALAALPALCASGYLLWLTLLSRRSRPPPYGSARYRFEIIVPAHNEESGIASTVESLWALDYPRELLGVTVVADNCTDLTAPEAQRAGARVLVRHAEEQRGKGYALAYAFDRILREGRADALAVVDADTTVSLNLLRAFSSRLDAGAKAIQADYAVQNPFDSWRTRLIAIALGAFHVLRSRARERLGLSCGLRGNGMCFAASLLKDVPHDSFSLVEDLEYGIRLGEAGHRVHYAGEAHVFGAMVTQAKHARSQRRRWEGGRWALARRHGLRLVSRAIAERSPVLFDLALDLIVPPLSFIILFELAGLGAAVALATTRGSMGPALFAWGASALFSAAYVLRGWALSGTGARGFLDLFCAPLYVIWRMTLLLRRSDNTGDEWIRTVRQSELFDLHGPRHRPRP
jgi:cellulose synthase/poly-beta-1,6-N-acetylglucosamine synthase-like glycosyltransferase